MISVGAAQRELLIVAFAIYDIPEIGQALLRAADRTVQIQLVIESPKESAGRLAYDNLRAFGSQVVERTQIFRWPTEQRPTDAQGRSGSLHAKCLVADQRTLLISSAKACFKVALQFALWEKGGLRGQPPQSPPLTL